MKELKVQNLINQNHGHKKELDVVPKHLKKGKSRDPNDHSNEIFHIDWG